MKSQQTGSEIPAGENEDVLALIIKCHKCDTQRAFKVNDSFALTITRASSGVEYTTKCNICGHPIGVQLAWTQRHFGWVAERLVFTKSITVEDQIGMFKAEGGKEI